uniref:Uncharacterized protein n=1 Tax=Physcomitrium patens TaxID=3218 RepID=A0A2K1K3F4_PHYPA|nr:hypothetical protein PHYPA_012782 [Physcomitrium patens]
MWRLKHSEAKGEGQNNRGLTDVSHLETHASQWKHSVVIQRRIFLDCHCIECKLQLKYLSFQRQKTLLSGTRMEQVNVICYKNAAALSHENWTRHSIASKEKDISVK